jgi:hypothetical protein
MKYISVNDYFLRLQTTSTIIFFSGILSFFALHYAVMMDYLTPVFAKESQHLMTGIFVGFAFLDALVSFVLVKVLLGKVKSNPSLGERMDRFVVACTVRFVLLSIGTTSLMAAFLLSGNQFVFLVYLGYLLFYGLAWPTRSRLCAELDLKQTERDVINGN